MRVNVKGLENHRTNFSQRIRTGRKTVYMLGLMGGDCYGGSPGRVGRVLSSRKPSVAQADEVWFQLWTLPGRRSTTQRGAQACVKIAIGRGNQQDWLRINGARELWGPWRVQKRRRNGNGIQVEEEFASQEPEVSMGSRKGEEIIHRRRETGHNLLGA
jgi:hypothetical protein